MKYCSIFIADFDIRKYHTNCSLSLTGAALVDVICQIQVELSNGYAHVVRIDAESGIFALGQSLEPLAVGALERYCFE